MILVYLTPVAENGGGGDAPILLASFHFEKCNIRATCYTWPIRSSRSQMTSIITRLGALAWVLLLETYTRLAAVFSLATSRDYIS